MTNSKARLIVLLGAIAATALTLATLLPARWIPRTGLGWEDEHFIIYFATTIVLSLASRRPYVVAIALTMFAGVLEACQGLTPDRFPDVTAALSGSAGVISATILVILISRAEKVVLTGRIRLTPGEGIARRRPPGRQIGALSIFTLIRIQPAAAK